MDVHVSRYQTLASHAAGLGADGLRRVMADQLGTLIGQATGQLVTIAASDVRYVQVIGDEPPTWPAATRWTRCWCTGWKWDPVNEHDERRDAATAELDRALAGALLTSQEERSVAGLRAQDAATIRGVVQLLWAVRVAETTRLAEENRAHPAGLHSAGEGIADPRSR